MKVLKIFFYNIDHPFDKIKVIDVQTTVKFLYYDHLWDCPKVVLKTTFGQSQRWSLIRGTVWVENEEKNNFNFTNKVFNGQDVLVLGGLNSGISLYFI